MDPTISKEEIQQLGRLFSQALSEQELLRFMALATAMPLLANLPDALEATHVSEVAPFRLRGTYIRISPEDGYLMGVHRQVGFMLISPWLALDEEECHRRAGEFYAFIDCWLDGPPGSEV